MIGSISTQRLRKLHVEWRPLLTEGVRLPESVGGWAGLEGWGLDLSSGILFLNSLDGSFKSLRSLSIL